LISVLIIKQKFNLIKMPFLHMIFYIIGIFKLLADMLYDFAHILNTFEGL